MCKGSSAEGGEGLFFFETKGTKSVLTVWVALLQRFCKAQTDTPLFFDTKGANEKGNRKRFYKRNAAWDISLVATSDKAYAALTRAHWRGGSYGLQCEHTAKL